MMSPLACRIVVFSLELVNHLSKFWLFEVASEKTKEKKLVSTSLSSEPLYFSSEKF
jgi:hypothetical protein